MPVLTDDDVERFVHEGFVHVEAAFPRDVAAACVEDLWALSGVDRDPATWTQPVVRVPAGASPALVAAINAERLCGALDQIVGVGRWARLVGYGTFPIRFPSTEDPGDAGWHVDGSFSVNDEPPPWCYGLNIWSKGRALLVLMLYSDVSEPDAPTRIRVGSHLDVARKLAPHGDQGLTFVEASDCPEAAHRPVVEATGRAGDAYLCHPFLLHSATWPHTGTQPRFMGQPAILHQPPEDRYRYERADGAYSPCERAVRLALGLAPA